jgi:very-short-patch-repair endonuclease
MEMAAVLACGDQAVLSHASAAALWGLNPNRLAWDVSDESDPDDQARPGHRGVVHVSLRSGCRAPAPRIRVHRIRTLGPEDITRLHGIPITAPARTVLDVAGSCDTQELERVMAAAERRGLASRREIASVVDRFPKRRGTREIRALLALEGGVAFVRSEAESLLQTVIRKAGLIPPRTNVMVAGHEVDCLWPDARLVVEIDGFAYHSSRAAFERDRDRDSALSARGYRVIRVTWRQLQDAPEVFLVRLAQALARG